jgi:uncharacterized protein DUF4304
VNKTGRALTDLITRLVKPAGFKRVRDQWIIESDECVGAINLQKSDYSNAYYLNFALSPRAILPEQIPEWVEFGIHGRVTKLPCSNAIKDALTFSEDAQVIDETATAAISACFKECLIPFITSHLTLAALRDFLTTDLAKHFLTSRRMREFVGLKV